MPFCLASPAHSELLIRKSRFIGCVEPIQDRHSALGRILALRAAHPGAAHVCWAMLAGGQSAANDDGEPSGTAGRTKNALPAADSTGLPDPLPTGGVTSSGVNVLGGAFNRC